MYREAKSNREGWNFFNPATELVDFQVVTRGPDKGYYLWKEGYEYGEIHEPGGSWERLYGAAAKATHQKYMRLVEEHKIRTREAKTRKENTEY